MAGETIKTEAICLDVRPWSRTSHVVSWLTPSGSVATVGKGVRSEEVHRACIRNGSVYLIAVGGAAAYLAKCITSEEVLAYDDLGTEALRRIDVVDFPVFVGIDTKGNDIYDQA